MYNPWYGFPPMWGSPPSSSPTLQDVITGMGFLEDLKKKMETEEKAKKEKTKKPELPKFSFGELWGAVMLFSIPITIGQLYLLQYVQQVLNATFVLPH